MGNSTIKFEIFLPRRSERFMTLSERLSERPEKSVEFPRVKLGTTICGDEYDTERIAPSVTN